MVIVIFAWLVGACIKQPEYSVIPQISWGSLNFVAGTFPNPDTLIIKFNFKDGDGDLGLASVDTERPDGKYVNPWYGVYDTTNINNFGYVTDGDYTHLSQYGNNLKYIDYKIRKTNFPGFSMPDTLNCVNWEISKNVGNKTDTLFIYQNLAAYTINVDIYTRRLLTDPYVYYDPAKNDCLPNEFRGTFPDLSNNRQVSPIDGTLTYKFVYLAFGLKFRLQYLKFDITVMDRAGHVSNTLEKSDVVI